MRLYTFQAKRQIARLALGGFLCPSTSLIALSLTTLKPPAHFLLRDRQWKCNRFHQLRVISHWSMQNCGPLCLKKRRLPYFLQILPSSLKHLYCLLDGQTNSQEDHTYALLPSGPWKIDTFFLCFLMAPKHSPANVCWKFFNFLLFIFHVCTTFVLLIKASSIRNSDLDIHALLKNSMESYESQIDTSCSVKMSLAGSENNTPIRAKHCLRRIPKTWLSSVSEHEARKAIISHQLFQACAVSIPGKNRASHIQGLE